MRKFIKENGLAYVIAMSALFSGFTYWAVYVIVTMVRILA